MQELSQGSFLSAWQKGFLKGNADELEIDSSEMSWSLFSLGFWQTAEGTDFFAYWPCPFNDINFLKYIPDVLLALELKNNILRLKLVT